MASPDERDQRHQAIRKALDRDHDPGSGTDVVIEATLGVWRRVMEGLAPMIGVRGVEALVSRSLDLTARQYPWLGPAGEHVDSLGPLASFQARLEVREPAVAAEASAALLMTFTDLLAAMIGASLTDQLLDPIWAAPPPESAKESAS